jgi:ubiquinone/menaquinone biosynthesis C-methylase UbiE
MEMSERDMKMVNSSPKEFVNKYYKFKGFEKLLRRNNVDLEGRVVLDAGCGSGHTLQLIAEKYCPGELYGFDSMPEQIDLARRRGLSAEIFVGDINDIALPTGRFDAVFIQGVLHHVPEWRKALEEISRVLKPGGVLLLEEPNKGFLDFVERFFKIEHPEESRFEWPELTAALDEAGFIVTDMRKQGMTMGNWRNFLCIKRA